MKTFSRLSAVVTAGLFAFAAPAAAFEVTWGTSWDVPALSLQDVLDDACLEWGYGPGCLDAATGYEGYLPGDADPPFWYDEILDGILVRAIAGQSKTNVFGWYVEEEAAAKPVIDGLDDGVIMEGPYTAGTTVIVNFGLPTKFGFYLDPNGPGPATNAPVGEIFFTNRSYNDRGEDGYWVHHAPYDGDPQALVYNASHLHNGRPTYIVAWEDLDSGSMITPGYTNRSTDNDYTDLVVEVTASSPVAVETTTWGAVKNLYRN